MTDRPKGVFVPRGSFPKEITIPLYQLGERQIMPLRTGMLTLGDDLGAVETGSGLGNDGIWVKWKDRRCYVRGLDIIRAIVTAIDPEEAKRIPTPSRRK